MNSFLHKEWLPARHGQKQAEHNTSLEGIDLSLLPSSQQNLLPGKSLAPALGFLFC